MTTGNERRRLDGLKRRAAGVCVGCGKDPVVPERSQCVKCLANLRRRTKQRSEERKSLGRCVQCGMPSAAGIVHCRRCRPLNKSVQARRRAAQKRRMAAEVRRRSVNERNTQARELVREHLHLLTRRQREVMALRVGLSDDIVRSGPHVAVILGISRQAVWVVEDAAWKRIKNTQIRTEKTASDSAGEKHRSVAMHAARLGN